METILTQIFNLLVEPPGNLVYHLVLVFATLSALQAVNLLERSDNHALAIRFRIGFFIILLAQVALFGISALGWQNLIDTQVVLPPLDRAVIAITLLWIAWIVLASQHSAVLDWAVAGLSLAVLAYSAFTMNSWSHVVGQVHFNTTALDFNWATIFVVLALVCGTLIAFLRPNNWGTGLGIYILVFIGGWLHFSTPMPESDYAAALRLALICIFPLLPGLTSPLRTGRQIQVSGTTADSEVIHPHRQAVSNWGQLATVTDQQTALPIWIKALGYSMDADQCLLISRQDSKQAPTVIYGHNLVEDQILPSTLDQAEDYNFLEKTALEGAAQQLQGQDGKAKSSKDFLTRLFGTSREQNYLIVPVGLKDAMWSTIILAVRDSRGEWTDEEARYLQNLCNETGKYLNNLPTEKISVQEINDLKKSLEKARKEVLEIHEEQRLLLEEMDTMRYERETSALNLNLESLMAVQRETHDTITALEAENELLRKRVQESPVETSPQDTQYLEQELRASLEETAHLQNALAEASITIMNLQRLGGQPGNYSSDAQNNIAATIQNMYGPVSALVAYTNLLSSETPRKLEPLQQNFLERIQNSTEKLRENMDTLIQQINLGNKSIELAPQPIAIDFVLDQAVGEITPLLQEKHIDLQFDLPELLPEVYADRDALQQIIIYLLQNAAAVTPEKGTIRLVARLDISETGNEFMVIRVTDEGGGVPADEVGKVFNKDYRSEHPHIQGINDAGTGLIIARTLVEAHNGRIWAESDIPGRSTYSVIFPLETHPANGTQQG